ncbi:MAG: ASKHA domain-containing protein [Firmicutes bacterium]|nr:ASKHA domain-containing protein [Bacillota bacterium]
MYREGKGLRCRICMGCGLCPGVRAESLKISESRGGAETLYVLTDSPFNGEASAGKADADGGKVTAGPFREKDAVSVRELSEASRQGIRLVTADVGTTTAAMLLYGKDGAVEDRYVALNPQAEYGADVISRIRAAEDKEKAADMRKKLREVLEQGLERFQKRLAAHEHLRMALAANTTMTYFLMGWDTSELGRAPFRASRLGSVETVIGDVPCFIFPGISAFVGGDIVAGMYASGMGDREEITLLIDLGTNGELALGNRNRRVACATAAGPAFEGGANRGVWGADMISRLAALKRAGLLDETGLLAEAYFESGIRVGNVHVTQQGVRAVQLAKGAIAAGIEVLLERYGVRAEQVDRVILAGGFGYYLKPEDAVEIGLLCPELAKKAMAGGNTALSGALRAGAWLLARQESGGMAGGISRNGEALPGSSRREGQADVLTQELAGLVSGTEVLNLAEEPDFEKRYTEAINLQTPIDNLIRR